MDRATDMLNEHEGIFTEPVMGYVPEEKIVQDEQQRLQDLNNQVSELCDRMPKCTTMLELKTVFQTAFKLTKDMPLQQNVQHIYLEAKNKLEPAQ